MKKSTVIVMLAMAVALTGCGKTKNEKNNKKEDGVKVITTEDIFGDNSSDSTVTSESEKQEQVVSRPVTSFENVKDTRTSSDGTDLIEVSYTRPTISIPGNEEAQKKIQADLDMEETEFYQTVDELQEMAENDKSQGYFNMMYSYDMSYMEKRADEKALSLIKGISSYTGGAHGYSESFGINYDVNTGKRLTIDDIVTDKAAYMEYARGVIIDQCDNGEYKDAVFPEYKDSIHFILEGEYWYFDEEGIVLISNAYTLAPYAAGPQSFVLPYADIPGLKDEYKE